MSHARWVRRFARRRRGSRRGPRQVHRRGRAGVVSRRWIRRRRRRRRAPRKKLGRCRHRERARLHLGAARAPSDLRPARGDPPGRPGEVRGRHARAHRRRRALRGGLRGHRALPHRRALPRAGGAAERARLPRRRRAHGRRRLQDGRPRRAPRGQAPTQARIRLQGRRGRPVPPIRRAHARRLRRASRLLRQEGQGPQREAVRLPHGPTQGAQGVPGFRR